jgi:hypothetical protein
MADKPAQTYATHAHRPTLTTVASAFGLFAFITLVVEMVRRPNMFTFALLSLAAAVICLVMISRLYIVRLQDRIIRVEMLLRLTRLGLEAEYGRLSKQQLVALRFASDAELPALLRRALAEKLTSKQIKEAVQDWQPDYHRT